MIINFDNTQLDIDVSDDSYRSRGIQDDHSLTLFFSMPLHVEIPVGAWAEFQGQRYELMQPENFKKRGKRNFEYTLILESEQAKLKKYRFRDTTSNRLKFSLTATPQMHVQMLVENLNSRESGWVAGEVLEAVEQVISYSHTDCLDALNMMADTFNTEWEIDGKTVHLRRVEYGKEHPLPLSYGRGNGFRPGVGRMNADDSNPTEVIFVQGGTRNIDPSKYINGSTELLLPIAQQLLYEGRTYISDDEGYSVKRADKELKTGTEDSLDCAHIYPSRVGTVSEVIVVDEEKNLYDIIDSTIPDSLDYSQCGIKGEKATIVFQDGMLAGREFDIQTNDDGTLTGYVHTERRFKIVPQTIDGYQMPGSLFTPAVGGKYAIFGISLPDAYVRDDATQTGASWDMFSEAAKYLYEHEDPRFSFTGELDGIWAKTNWLEIGGKIRLGGYVLFSDVQFQPEGVLIRIKGIRDYINRPHSPVIELSNVTAGTGVSGRLKKLENDEAYFERMQEYLFQYTKRTFRDATETAKMLQNAGFENFTEAIYPVTVQTMQLLVGDESLQFRFVNSKTNPVEISHDVTYNSETKKLHSPAGIIQHMTLGIDSLAPSHGVNEYRFWDVSDYLSPPLEDAQSYYLYARVEASGTTGIFTLSENAIKMNAMPGYYHLLLGILNSTFEGSRSYVDMYGFTEVLPGQVRVNRVISPDGTQYFDMLKKMFHIGDANNFLDYNSSNDGALRLKGVLVQSQSGAEEPLGVFRGEYNGGTTYYRGDEVTYQGSTFRYVSNTPAAGRLPTNTSFWAVVGAKGADGQNGSYTSFVFKQSATQPATPSGTSQIPQGWSDAPAGGSSGVTNVSHGTAWAVQPDGMRRSPAIADGGFAKNRITFTTSAAGQSVTVRIKVSSEINYDFAAVGLLDNTGLSLTSNYTDRISGEMERAVTIHVPTAGTHFVEVGYGKDGSMSSGADCAWYEVVTADMWWMSKATVSFNGTSWVAGGWSVPVRVTGEDGLAGADGKFWDYKYRVSATQPSTPAGLQPSGWYDQPPALTAGNHLWMSYCEKNATQTAILWGWSTPVRISGEQGEQGVKGDSPAAVYRGDYSSSAVYYGTSARVDIVKHNGYFYVAKTTAGNGFSGQTPTNTAFWTLFGAQFESVATKLLLAEYANIGGLVFRNNRLESVDGSFYIDGNNNTIVIGKGIFNGSVATPFIEYGGGFGGTLALLENFNYSMNAYLGSQTIYLPSGAQYNGVICRIYNSGMTSNEGDIYVRASSGYISQNKYNGFVSQIAVPIGCIGIFQAVYRSGISRTEWICLNYKEMQS